MARTFKIYKKGVADAVVSGASPLVIPTLTADTQYNAGDYNITAVEDGKESEPVDIPAFKTNVEA